MLTNSYPRSQTQEEKGFNHVVVTKNDEEEEKKKKLTAYKLENFFNPRVKQRKPRWQRTADDIFFGNVGPAEEN